MNTESISLILASNSPRRAFLLKECGFEFKVRPTNTNEDFDPEMDVAEIPKMLAAKKAETALKSLKDNELVLTSDTVVIFDDEILNKPNDEQEAVHMLNRLSGQTHKVITAVCLANTFSSEFIEETSWVTFFDLDKVDIKNYVNQFKPFDKAGAYGAQECLPDGYNPCSGHERVFLNRIGNPDLLSKSKSPDKGASPMVAIKEIAGSYFNVMGLPIAHLYDRLRAIIH
jgi:septum formation protein